MTAAGQLPAAANGSTPARRGSVAASVAAILACQDASGAIMASPDFSQYQFCWLRDASFVAYALDRSGEHAATARYHRWVAAAVAGIGAQIDTAVQRRLAGQPLDRAELPPCRFGLDGSVAADDWPNFQVDGYGTWLWALREHLRRTGTSITAETGLRDTVIRVARFVAAFALDACYDVWEENGDGVHVSTLACVYGGLLAAADLLGDQTLASRAREVQSHVRMTAAAAGRLAKSSVSSEVDASMIWLATPFGLMDSQDPLYTAALAEITSQLRYDGGIRRYPSDTFFGGGAWPVLTASLGWHAAATGDRAAAEQSLAWIAGHIDAAGRLGEQFGGERRQPAYYREWVDRWGHPARELAWSHAMYVVLSLELETEPGHGTGAGTTSGKDDPAFLRESSKKGAGQ